MLNAGHIYFDSRRHDQILHFYPNQLEVWVCSRFMDPYFMHVLVYFVHAEYRKILKFGTPQTIAIIVLEIESLM